MSKIQINQAAEILKRNAIEPSVLRQIVEEMNMVANAEGDGERPDPIKKQYAILISDPEGRLPAADFVGWILQLPENESVQTTQERIFRAAYDFNATRKGRLMPAKSVGEAIEAIPAKHFKEADLWIKTKTPVLVLRTSNEIPKDVGSEFKIAKGGAGNED